MEKNLKLVVSTMSQDVVVDIERALANTTFVGIDFGTSTTTVTRLIFDGDTRRLRSEPLKIVQLHADGLRDRDHLVPTVIALTPRGLIYGRGAKDCLRDTTRYAEEINVWSCFKMRLGEQYCYPKTFLSSARSRIPGVVLETPKDAARLFFAYLHEQIQEAVARDGLPKSIRYAVTVPASFAVNQRTELMSAIRDAGLPLNSDALLDEPNSAFMGTAAFFSEQGREGVLFRRDEPVRALIFDFGAGTCDISMLEVDPKMKMRNLAISKFTALGGRDIDRKIAEDYLYPQLTIQPGEEPTKDVKEGLYYALRTPAERLKIAICSEYDKSGVHASAFADAEREARDFTEGAFLQRTQRFGVFSCNNPSMNSSDFSKLMRRFTAEVRSAYEKGDKTIFEPIENVMQKAKVSKDELDFVILVGGSSKNPFIKEALSDYFGRFVEIIEPGDIQTLVARGAAIHAFAVNGLGVSFIHPITSDDIRIETADGSHCIFAAGTPVPTDVVQVHDLYIGEDSDDDYFGIPFYASIGRESPIGVAKFNVPGVPPGTRVALSCRLTADKVLKYGIEVNGREFTGDFAMPVSTQSMSEKQQARARAENNLRISMMSNNGEPSVEALKAAAKACQDVEAWCDAADHYRNAMFHNREKHFEREIADAYREAGGHNEAELEWCRRAYDYNENYLNHWYLIWALKRNEGWGSEELKECLADAIDKWPDDMDLKYIEWCRLKAVGERTAAERICRDMFEEWNSHSLESLGEYTLERFLHVARAMGEQALSRRIEDAVARMRSLHNVNQSGSGFSLVRQSKANIAERK